MRVFVEQDYDLSWRGSYSRVRFTMHSLDSQDAKRSVSNGQSVYPTEKSYILSIIGSQVHHYNRNALAQHQNHITAHHSLQFHKFITANMCVAYPLV